MTSLKLIPAIMMAWLAILSTANAIAAAIREDGDAGFSDEDNAAQSPYHLLEADFNENDDDKRAMGALRLGRAGSGSRQSSNNNRAMSALRLGRRGDWGTDPSSTDSEDGHASESEKTKRKSMSMLRLGRGNEAQLTPETKEEEEEKRAMSALRLGRKRSANGETYGDEGYDKKEVEKKAMGMLRLGRANGARDSENTRLRMDRRKSMSMLRLG